MSWTLKDFDRCVEKLELDPIDHKKSKKVYILICFSNRTSWARQIHDEVFIHTVEILWLIL